MLGEAISLADSGPVAILLVGIALLALGFLTGRVVPGWLYRQEREARLLAEEQAKRQTEMLLRATGKPVESGKGGDDAAP